MKISKVTRTALAVIFLGGRMLLAQPFQDSFEQGYTFFDHGVGVVHVRPSGSTVETDYAQGISASDGSFYARLMVQPLNNINNAQPYVCQAGVLGVNDFCWVST